MATTSDGPPAEPKIVDPQNVQHDCPPPSYEEIMGHQTLGNAKLDTSSQQVPPLSYVDIMPKCLDPGNIKRNICPTFDKFSVLIEAVNQWLLNNPSFAVWKCETVERKVTSGVNGEVIIEMDKMIFHESSLGFNVFIRGLRLWLVKKTNPNDPPQQLGMTEVVPEQVMVNMDRMTHGFGGMGMFLISDPYYMRQRSYLAFEGLTKTLENLNNRLKDSPIPGTILSVEASSHKSQEGIFQKHLDLDVDKTCWYEDGSRMKRFITTVRVYYIVGPPAYEDIHIHDFTPPVTRPGDGMRPTQFENWSALMHRVSTWVPYQTGARIVNFQTSSASYSEFAGKINVNTDTTDDVESTSFSQKYLKFMRIFYVRKSGETTPLPAHLYSRTFLPVRTSRSDFETMNQTMFRIDAWLRVTGLPIYNVETSLFLFNPSRPSGVEQDRTTTLKQGFTGNKYLTAITVYFPCPYSEPHASYLPLAVPYDPRSNSESCQIL